MINNEGFQMLDLLCLSGCLIDLIVYPVYILAQSQKLINFVLIFEQACDLFKTILVIALVNPKNDDKTNIKIYVYQNFAGSILSFILALVFLPYILKKIKEKIRNENQSHQQGEMAESISFKANPQFITELRNVTGDSIVRYILGHSESLLMMRMLSHREIGSSNQAKIFCSQIAQIFLRPTEERVFEMISTEKNKQENEQDYQFRKMKKNKKQKLIKQGQDSNSNQNTESKKKPKIVLSSQSIAELCAYSIRLALYFGFASFVYIASLSDEIVLINYGRHLFNPDSVSVTVPFLVPRLERIFIISLLPMALCGVGESIVRAVVNGKLLLISNTIMASLSAIYIFAVGFGISLGQILDDSSNGKKFGFGALIEAGKMLIEALFGKGLHLKQRTTGSEVHFSGAIYVAKLTILNFIVRFSVSVLIIYLSLNKKKNTEEKHLKEEIQEENNQGKENSNINSDQPFKLSSILPSFTIFIYVVISGIIIPIIRQVLHQKAGPGVILLPPKLEIVYLASVGFFFLIYLLLIKRNGILIPKRQKTA